MQVLKMQLFFEMLLICNQLINGMKCTLFVKELIYLVHNIILLTLNKCLFQLNADVNAFQRYFVNDMRRVEEMERILSKTHSYNSLDGIVPYFSRCMDFGVTMATLDLRSVKSN